MKFILFNRFEKISNSANVNYHILTLILSGLLTRTAFYTYLFVPGFSRDSWAFVQPAFQISNGQMPDFSFFSPFYSYCLFFFNFLSPYSIKGIILLQSISTLAIIIYCLYLVRGTKFYFIYFVTILLFYSSPFFINIETSLSPLIIFFNLILIVYTFLSCERKVYGTIGIITALILLTRPQGLPFSILIILFLAIYDSFKASAKVILFMSIILGCQIIYNKLTINKAILYGQAGKNNLSSSIYFLEKDETYSINANKTIDSLNKIMQPVRKEYYSTWNFDRLSKIVNSNNYENSEMFYSIYFHFNNSDYDQIKYYDEINRIAYKSKFNNPTLYLKYISTNLYNSLEVKPMSEVFYFNELQNRTFYIKRTNEFKLYENDILNQYMYKEYYEYYFGNKEFQPNILNYGAPLIYEKNALGWYSRFLNFYCYCYNLIFSKINLIIVNCILFISIVIIHGTQINKIYLMGFTFVYSNILFLSMLVFVNNNYVFPFEFIALFIMFLGISELIDNSNLIRHNPLTKKRRHLAIE